MSTPTNPLPSDGGPAFPHAHEDYPFQHGMSLRDWFAGQALSGLLADPQVDGMPLPTARVCYEYADAMLKAREQTPTK